MRKLKRPDGELHEEYVVIGCHFFERGILTGHDHDWTLGDYTGRFMFQHKNGDSTRWHTEHTAPKWLLAMYREAVAAKDERGGSGWDVTATDR